MGVLSTNRAQISSGGLISASFVSDVYDILTGTTPDTAVFSGSLSVSGSLNVSSTITGSFTGSLVGDLTGTSTTASYGMLAVSSSGDLYFASASAWYKVTLG